jgi:PadR family transcriptional regulator AphA
MLGLLAIKPWTNYELAAQMDRTLSRFWPRAKSKLYEEPKKLAALGLARGVKESVGRRPRTVYSITDEGRRALALWLATPGAGPVLEFEQLLQVFFAENGTTGDLPHPAGDAPVGARAHPGEHRGRTQLSGRPRPFPRAGAILVLTGRFLDDLLETLDRWAGWASETAAKWPDEPRRAAPDVAALEATVRQAVERSARFRATGAKRS